MISALKKTGKIWALLIAFALFFTMLSATTASAAELKVTFEVAGGTPIPSVQQVVYGGFAEKPSMTPTLKDHLFVKWINADGVLWDFPNTPIKQDTVIYAEWEQGQSTHEVKLRLNGGKLDASWQGAEVMHVPDTMYAQKPIPDPTKPGYRFDGWFTDADFTTSYEFNTPVTASIELHAKWHKRTSASGGGGGAVEVVEQDKDQDAGKAENQDKEPDEDENQDDTDPGNDYEDTVVLTDITDHWAESYIQTAVDKGFVKGFPDGSFRPEGSLNRAEFTCMLVRALDIPISLKGNVFVDVLNHWSKEMVMAAAAAGVVIGRDTEHFAPDDYITREEMTNIAVRAVKLQVGANPKVFNDQSDITLWAVEPIQAATSHNVISGYQDGFFRPQKTATRAEAVVLLINILQIK